MAKTKTPSRSFREQLEVCALLARRERMHPRVFAAWAYVVLENEIEGGRRQRALAREKAPPQSGTRRRRRREMPAFCDENVRTPARPA